MSLATHSGGIEKYLCNSEIFLATCQFQSTVCARPGAFWSIASQKFGSRIDETGMFGVRLLPAELDSTILHTRLGQKCVTRLSLFKYYTRTL